MVIAETPVEYIGRVEYCIGRLFLANPDANFSSDSDGSSYTNKEKYILNGIKLFCISDDKCLSLVVIKVQ